MESARFCHEQVAQLRFHISERSEVASASVPCDLTYAGRSSRLPGREWDLGLPGGFVLLARHGCCCVVWSVWLWLKNRVGGGFDFFATRSFVDTRIVCFQVYQSKARSGQLRSHILERSKKEFERGSFVKKHQFSIGRGLILLLLRTKTLAGNLLMLWRRRVVGKEEVSVVSVYEKYLM
jgi:hypothetical protein